MNDKRCWHVPEHSPSKCCSLPASEALHVTGKSEIGTKSGHIWMTSAQGRANISRHSIVKTACLQTACKTLPDNGPCDHARYDWTTGVPDNGNVWRKCRVVPRACPSYPLICAYFHRVGNKERFRLPGAGGEHFHCTVDRLQTACKTLPDNGPWACGLTNLCFHISLTSEANRPGEESGWLELSVA